MEVDRSSSNDLSSAPSSDNEASYNQPQASTSLQGLPAAHTAAAALLPPDGSSTKTSLGHASASATRQEGAPVKKPAKPRKKKEVDPNAPPAPKKERKPRKPRESKDSTSARATKKVKTENDPPNSIISQQFSVATNLNQSHLVQPIQPLPLYSDSRPTSSHEAAKLSQNGFSMHGATNTSRPQSPTQPRYQTTPQAPFAQPIVQQRSRMAFDPVRGIERSSEQPQTITYPNLNETPPRATPAFRPSASPAINSILNHESHESTFVPLPTFTRALDPQSSVQVVASNGTSTNSMVVDEPRAKFGSNTTLLKKTSPADKSDTETEGKRKRAKEQPAPAPIGSGLLNSTFFGGDASSDGRDGVGKGVNIVLQVDLEKNENKIFNFARMAEEKYGFAAVYPRQAAQKERLAKVAAAGAALERSASGSKRGEISVAESGDEDLSVDIDRDSDNDGDINMTGANGTNENSGIDGPAPRQRRKKKDDYDMDDPFVDDSEALWEAQAAASRDGFFVYMGSLVTEEKPKEDKTAETTSKRGGRGRGRGGGPGSRGGRAAATAAADSTTKAASKRGGGVSRKPRMTKAERQQRELEKEQREQEGSALATKPPAPSAP